MKKVIGVGDEVEELGRDYFRETELWSKKSLELKNWEN